MPMHQLPGAMFLGTLVNEERAFCKTLFEQAKGRYKRFVEPCAGAFAMSHLAKEVGWDVHKIEASDVMLFSTVLGYAIMGKPLDELEIRAEGYEDEDLTDAATVFWTHLCLRQLKEAGKEYNFALLDDLHYRKAHHIEELRKQVDRAKQLLTGFNYRALCMWKHLEECLGDPEVLVCINPPTYAAGFEKWFDTGGRLTWKEPEYDIFDPKTGLTTLMKEWCQDAKALVVCYEENAPGMTAGEPVFARFAVRNGINVYLTSNRPDEVEALVKKHVTRSNEMKLESLKYPLMTGDYEVTEKSTVSIVPITANEATYYRLLWTHNFMGKASSNNSALIIDGRLAGIFGHSTQMLDIGKFGMEDTDILLLTYGMTIRHDYLRLGRLVTMLALCRDTIRPLLSSMQYEKCNVIQTTMLTKYPESKENRGVMKLKSKQKHPLYGFKLTYEAPINEKSWQEVLKEWLTKEAKWKKERARAKELQSAQD